MGSSISNLAVGDRVSAYATSWFLQTPDYGAFQNFVLVPAENVAVIPANLSFNEASILPLAFYTAWMALRILDIPQETLFQQSDKKGILIWGVGGSVGSVAMQIARLMGFHVYATASEKHHSYLQNLGKGTGLLKLFDYKGQDVVAKIVSAAKDDGIVLDLAIEAAAGNLKDIVAILNQVKGSTRLAKVAAAPFSMAYLWYSFFVPTCLSGVHVQFVDDPSDEKERSRYFAFIYNSWLPEKLETGDFVPSPKVKVVPGGIKGIENGLQELKSGVSGIKLVLEV